MWLLRRIVKILISRVTLALAVLLICADGALECIGLPDFAVEMLACGARHYGLALEVDRIFVGIVRGIRLCNARISAETPLGVTTFRASEFGMSISSLAILKKQASIRGIHVDNADFVFYGRGAHPRFILHDVAVKYSSDVASSGMMEVDANLNDIRIHFVGNCLNPDKLPEYLNANADDDSSKALLILDGIARRLAECDFGGNDTFLNIRGQIDCADLKKSMIAGDFSVSDALVPGFVVSCLRGSILFANDTIKLDRLTWITDGGVMRGNGEYCFANNTCSWYVDGNIEPANVVKLLGRDFVGVSLINELNSPWHISCVQEKTVFDKEKISPVVNCDFHDVVFKGITISSGKFSLAYDEGVLSINDLVIKRDVAGREYLEGDLDYFVPENQFAFDLDGSLDCMELANDLGASIPSWLQSLLGGPVRFSAILDKSPLDCKDWKLDGTFMKPRAAFNSWRLANLSGNIHVENGIATLNKVQGRLNGGDGGVLQLSCSENVSELIALLTNSAGNREGRLDIEHNLQLYHDNDGSLELCFDETGHILYRPRGRQIEGTSAGIVRADKVYQAFLAKSDIPGIAYMAPYACGDKPADFDFKFEPFRIGMGGDWTITGNILADGGSFGTSHFDYASGTMTLKRNSICFNNVAGVSDHGENVYMDIKVNFNPCFFEITNMELHGDPMLASPFITGDRANQVFCDIWDGVEWNPDDMPMIKIDNMCFLTDLNSSHWEYTLDGEIEASDFKYKSLDLQKLACTVNLDLPGEMRVSPAFVRADDAELHGECRARFGNLSSVEFSINETKGELKPFKFLDVIVPELSNNISELSFSDGSQVTCSGSFFIDGPLNLKLDGNVVAPICSYGKWSASDVTATWGFANDSLHWNVESAKWLDGNVRTSGVYNTRIANGNVLLLADNLNWNKIVRLVKKDMADDATPIPGNVNLECNLSLQKNWGGRPYNLDGNGHFALRDADLWSVPLMKSLYSLLDYSGLRLFGSRKEKGGGSISELDADLEFNGTRLVIPRMYTNGTLISLSGNGEYSWTDNRLRFLVSGEPLKDITILSTLLKPLSWAFKAELKGTLEKSQWQLKTAFSGYDD